MDILNTGRKILWKWVSFDSSVYATKLLNFLFDAMNSVEEIVDDVVKIFNNSTILYGPKPYNYLLLRYSSIPFAAALPAPIARITVAAPVTASPPA